MKTTFVLAALIISFSCYSQSDDNQNTPSMKVTFGAGVSLMSKFKRGNVDEFYQRIAPDPTNLPDDGANGFKFLSIGFQSSAQGKPILGLELQLTLTHPSRAIWGENTGYGYATDMYFSAKFVNVALKLGLPLSSRGYFVVEPGIDMGFMNGKVGIYNSLASYTQEFYEERAIGIGGHAACGLDLPLGNVFVIALRAGYRFVKIDESHADASSDTGYSTFYVNGVDGETLKVDWSGMYMTAGIILLLGKK